MRPSKEELKDLNKDIANITRRLINADSFEEKRAYEKLLKLLNIWKKRGY